jgi:nucleotide-binding universal stress UspA family protein
MKIKTILVPTDFSENAQLAFEHAFELAQQTGAKLILLHVQSGSDVRTAAREGLLRPGDVDPKIKQNVEKLVKLRFSEMLAGHDVSAVKLKAEPLRGDPDSVICSYAESIGADVIFMGSRGNSAVTKVKKILLGSVTMAVLRKSRVPVVVITDKIRKRSRSQRA